ncbi:hypothetical protein M0813_27545 [Anaeramoeba flamelloides]|uniref:PAS domain-containing protein n=1 Tax=Anaeramoeba flamelloides TaxID=1746091 RepID=A0ABQ8XW17_9EUKA|nr:hypothetical protein M0813_27545 [Anaeramoeba flamelloides]
MNISANIENFSIKKSKKYLKRLEKQPKPVIIINKNLNILHFNTQFLKTFHYKKKQATNLSLLSITSETQTHVKQKNQEYFSTVLNSNLSEKATTTEFYCTFVTQNQTTFWGSVFVAVLKFDNNIVYQLVIDQSSKLPEKTTPKSTLHKITKMKSNTKSFSLMSTTSLSDNEVEESFDDEVSSLKRLIRTLNNKMVEISLFKGIKGIETLFETFMIEKNNQIRNQIHQLKTIREKQTEQYSSLEKLLQRRLTGLQSEKKILSSLLLEQELLEQKLEMAKKTLKRHIVEEEACLQCIEAKNEEDVVKIQKKFSSNK